MLYLSRVWTTKQGQEVETGPKHGSTWIIWDLGDEQWEMRQNTLRHFRILKRTLISPQRVEEVVELLPECPIPLEALARHSVGLSLIHI